MGRYTHDPTSVTASLVVLPKDFYEFKLGKPKPFERTARAGHQTYGLYIPATVEGGPSDGKKIIIRLMLHTEGAAAMAKRFQIAAYGLPVNEQNEKVFDEWAKEQDWGYDPESGEIGEGWKQYEGLHVACDCDVQPQKDEKGEIVADPKTGDPIMQQVFGTWTSVGTGIVG